LLSRKQESRSEFPKDSFEDTTEVEKDTKAGGKKEVVIFNFLSPLCADAEALAQALGAGGKNFSSCRKHIS
jgi:hypothetical protein